MTQGDDARPAQRRASRITQPAPCCHGKRGRMGRSTDASWIVGAATSGIITVTEAASQAILASAPSCWNPTTNDPPTARYTSLETIAR